MDELTGEEATFLDEARKAVDSEDSERLSELVSDFSEYCFKDPTSKSDGSDFSTQFIDGFLGLIEDPTFLQMEDSFKLLILLHNDWARIEPRFYAKLFERLERIYPGLADNTSHLIIAELFGEYLANADGLHGLERLRAVKDEVARAHVAHGFKGLASDAAPEAVRNAAAARLNEMARDPAEPVRAEALAAIASLKSRPPKSAGPK
jgi:hypothetical protein